MACPAPFLNEANYPGTGGFLDGRMCMGLGNTTCCLPCPMTDWAYSDSFNTITQAAEWVSVVSSACCLFLLMSWAVLPIDKTHRHYLSICVTVAVACMNLGFIIPLAGQPDQCYNRITPNDMHTSSVCGSSGSFLILGGWGAVLWVFLRSLSLHLQICWQVVVGRSFLWFSQCVGWGVPVVGATLALALSGVSFRFGKTCHINHSNSLADMWIPLLVFAGATLVIQFATFGYCIKVYMASLADNNATTEKSSGLPSSTNSIRTMTPRQAYRRVRRVLQLQWRGIAIVLIIIGDVIFFALVFVFQDNTIVNIKQDPSIASGWIACLAASGGDKEPCLGLASAFVVDMPTTGAVLVLLSMNGLWLLLLLGRWSMATGWIELVTGAPKPEFVSVDALGGPYDLKMSPDPLREGPIYPPLRSYLAQAETATIASEATMVDGGADGGSGRNNREPEEAQVPLTMGSPRSPPEAAAASPGVGRRTPAYAASAARYHAPTQSFSSPRPPTRERDGSRAGPDEAQAGASWASPPVGSAATRPHSPPRNSRRYSPPTSAFTSSSPYSPPTAHHFSPQSHSSGRHGLGLYQHGEEEEQEQDMNPLQMNRI